MLLLDDPDFLGSLARSVVKAGEFAIAANYMKLPRRGTGEYGGACSVPGGNF